MFRIIQLLMCLLLISCEFEKKEEVGPIACPLIAYLPAVQVTLDKATIPQVIAIEIEGELKYDECLEEPVIDDGEDPYVYRYSDISKLIFGATYFNGYPETLSFRIIDRINCDSPQDITYFEVFNESVQFSSKEHPCGAISKAEIYITD